MINNIIFYIKIQFLKRIMKKDTMEIEIIRYRKKGVTIGEKMRAFSPPYSKEPYLLHFGNNITISTGVKFTTHDNSIIKVAKEYTDLFGEIRIEDNCFIGQNSIILPGVSLEKDTIVAAGSVVTKSFYEEGIIIGGNPAKKIGETRVYKEKYLDYGFNIKGLSSIEVKEKIMQNREKLIKK